jgi:hypothetical protein
VCFILGFYLQERYSGNSTPGLFILLLRCSSAKKVGIDGEYVAPFSKSAQAPPPEVDWEDLLPEDKLKYAAFFPEGKAYAAAEAGRVKKATGKATAASISSANSQKSGKAANTASKVHKDSQSDEEDDHNDPELDGLPLKRGRKRTAPADAPIDEPAASSSSRPKREKKN